MFHVARIRCRRFVVNDGSTKRTRSAGVNVAFALRVQQSRNHWLERLKLLSASLLEIFSFFPASKSRVEDAWLRFSAKTRVSLLLQCSDRSSADESDVW